MRRLFILLAVYLSYCLALAGEKTKSESQLVSNSISEYHNTYFQPTLWLKNDFLQLGHAHPTKQGILETCSWADDPCKYLFSQTKIFLTFLVVSCLHCVGVMIFSVLFHCDHVHQCLYTLLYGWGWNKHRFKLKENMNFLNWMRLTSEDIKLEISVLSQKVCKSKNENNILHRLKEWYFDYPVKFKSSIKLWVWPIISGQPYFARLASFQAAGFQNVAISFIQLAKAGYRFCDGSAMCDGCGSVVGLRDFLSHPAESRYHNAPQCPFIEGKEQEADKADNNPQYPTSHTHNEEPLGKDEETSQQTEEAKESSRTKKDSGYMSDDDLEAEIQSPPVGYQAEGGSELVMFDGTFDSVPSVSSAAALGDQDSSSAIYESIQCPAVFSQKVPQQKEKQNLWKKALSTASVVTRWKRLRTYSNSLDSAGESSTFPLDQYLELDESKYFSQEVAYVAKRSVSQSIFSIECQKNKGHYGYFPMRVLKLEHLHPKVRSREMLNFVKKLGQLTVRIVVKGDSPRRPQVEDRQQDMKKRVGTGMILLDDFGFGEEKHTPAAAALYRLSSFLESGRGRVKQAVYIQTSCHVVFDDKEAANTTVELFFQHLDRRGVITIRGTRVVHSGVLGDSHSILVCKTGDRALLNSINTLKTEFLHLERNLPNYLKCRLTKRMLVLSHPHGSTCVLSHGEGVIHKYALKRPTDSSSKPRLAKEGIPVKAGVKELYQVLLYTADTCQGSCGAPVVSYKKIGKDAKGEKVCKLQLWIHHGQDKHHNLSVSALKVCTPQEIEEYKNRPAPSSDEEDQVPTYTPPPKTKNIVMHPEYVEYTNRLASLKDWPSTHIHKATVLAFAGFFYAGYKDCVRCFFCGIGLRSWKNGDSVFGEHKKHKPTCKFLSNQFEQYGEEELILGTHDILAKLECEMVPYEMCEPVDQEESTYEASIEEKPVEPSHYTNSSLIPYKEASQHQILLHLARSENNHLQNVVLCKVCHQQPVKELLLPCSHLCSCEGCCKMLSHCPVCEGEIVATVDTYFS